VVEREVPVAGAPAAPRHSDWPRLLLLVIGLIAGALARLLIPGRQDIGILMTIVLGIVGSFVGGFLDTRSSTRTRRTASSNLPGSSARSSEP